eukprot:1195075-Prorocentrum_minimum.AAC.1
MVLDMQRSRGGEKHKCNSPPLENDRVALVNGHGSDHRFDDAVLCEDRALVLPQQDVQHHAPAEGGCEGGCEQGVSLQLFLDLLPPLVHQSFARGV